MDGGGEGRGGGGKSALIWCVGDLRLWVTRMFHVLRSISLAGALVGVSVYQIIRKRNDWWNGSTMHGFGPLSVNPAGSTRPILRR